MTDATNENETTQAAPAEGSTLERAMENVQSEGSSLFESAPAAFGEWVSETREVMNRHWGQAMERARTRLEAAAPEAAVETPVEDAEPAAPTPLHRLLGSAIVVRAQERGAALLLGSMRKLRAQLEQLEANLEAARPHTA